MEKIKMRITSDFTKLEIYKMPKVLIKSNFSRYVIELDDIGRDYKYNFHKDGKIIPMIGNKYILEPQTEDTLKFSIEIIYIDKSIAKTEEYTFCFIGQVDEQNIIQPSINNKEEVIEYMEKSVLIGLVCIDLTSILRDIINKSLDNLEFKTIKENDKYRVFAKVPKIDRNKYVELMEFINSVEELKLKLLKENNKVIVTDDNFKKLYDFVIKFDNLIFTYSNKDSKLIDGILKYNSKWKEIIKYNSLTQFHKNLLDMITDIVDEDAVFFHYIGAHPFFGGRDFRDSFISESILKIEEKELFTFKPEKGEPADQDLSNFITLINSQKTSFIQSEIKENQTLSISFFEPVTQDIEKIKTVLDFFKNKKRDENTKNLVLEILKDTILNFQINKDENNLDQIEITNNIYQREEIDYIPHREDSTRIIYNETKKANYDDIDKFLNQIIQKNIEIKDTKLLTDIAKGFGDYKNKMTLPKGAKGTKGNDGLTLTPKITPEDDHLLIENYTVKEGINGFKFVESYSLTTPSLKGEKGEKGDKGDKGEPGIGLSAIFANSVLEMKQKALSGQYSDNTMIIISTNVLEEDNGKIYLYKSNKEEPVYMGDLSDAIAFRGPKGDTGEKGEKGDNITFNDIQITQDNNLKFILSDKKTITTKEKLNIFTDEFFNKIYPVGSIYLSINDTDPKTLFGGDWQRLDEGYLYSTNDTIGTIGSKTLNIKENNMPSHNHSAIIENYKRQSEFGSIKTMYVEGRDNKGYLYTKGGFSPAYIKPEEATRVPAGWGTDFWTNADIKFEEDHTHKINIENKGNSEPLINQPLGYKVYAFKRVG